MKWVEIISDTYIAGISFVKGLKIEVDESIARQLVLNSKAIYIEDPKKIVEELKTAEATEKTEKTIKKGGKI